MKQLYDKWIPMSSFEDWTLENYFVDVSNTSSDAENKGHKFYFIDSYYNNIGDKLLINPKNLMERIDGLLGNGDVNAMMLGYNAIRDKIIEIQAKGYEASNKESSVLGCLTICREATARGIIFDPISLTKSDSKNFLVSSEGHLIPPFRTIDGLGDTVSKTIVEEREKREFLSIEDLQVRGKLSSTLIEKMRDMHILDGLPESSQLSLF